MLAWLLLTRTRPFNLHAPAYKRYFRHLPGKVIKVLRVLNLTRKLFLIKYIKSARKYEIINVGFDGHILIITSGGYKVFNLKRKIVATQFKPELKEENFKNIIKNLESIKDLEISPKIKDVDYKNKCFYEEYINLYKAERFYPVSTYFYNKILPTWERNINKYPRSKMKLIEYVTDQESFILNRINTLGKDGYDKDFIIPISSYVEKISKKIISEYSQTSIYITLSHGDLHAWNVLLNNNDSILIDWDTLKERSLFHDLYYMFIHNLFGRDKVDFKEFLFELYKCFDITCSKLQNENDEITCNNFHKDLYRMLFYLEYIYLDIEKRIDMYSDRLSITDRVGKINECIKVFEDIEMKINEQNFYANPPRNKYFT